MSIGTDVPRVDGIAKLNGSARYVDDIAVPGVLHGGTIRSTVARGRIKQIHFDPAINWDEYVVVDHRDIPGPNEVKLIENDQPALVAQEIRHKYEAIVLIAHPSQQKLREALRAIRVDVEPMPAVTDVRQELTPDLIQYGRDNVFKRIDIRKGDPAPVFDRAAHVVEGEYITGAQEHVYLEPHGMLAWQEDGKLVISGSMQCPYYVLDGLTHFFERPPEAFRVVQIPTGGGFGGKEDYPSLLAIHAGLLAEKSGRPVKIIYDRHEDMIATTKRHPSRVRHRTALDSDGRLLAMEIDVLFDGGAYMTLSPVVLSRGTIHAGGPYACDHMHIHGEARLTNSPPYGAFRGFGAPQTLFALERHMDEIARRIGIDPVELGRRNLLAQGQTTATSQVRRDPVNHAAQMDEALTLIDRDARQRAHDEFNKTHPYLRRGIGVATFFHGAGFTGAGESYLASKVWVEGLSDGTVRVLTAQTDMGQGTNTILTQVAAEALRLPENQIHVTTPDTSLVPNSGPTVASRTAMVVGNLVSRACGDLARKATEPCGNGGPREGGDEGTAKFHFAEKSSGATKDEAEGTAAQRHSGTTGTELQDAIRAWHAAHPGERLLGRAEYEKPAEIQWDEQNYRGDAYATFGWATYAAEVEIDLRTYAARVTDFVAMQEIGRVLNPTLATGQIAGGVVQAIGWALTEEIVLQDGAMANAQMTNYIIPTAADLPPIRVVFQEEPAAFGPGGAKGIGELPMDGPAPAIANAVSRALNISANEIPLTPERLMALLENVKA